MSSPATFISSSLSSVPQRGAIHSDFAQTQLQSDSGLFTSEPPPHAFHSRALFTFLVGLGIFNLAGRLIKDLQTFSIPASSSRQKDKFTNLLAASSPLYDRSNGVVLPKIDGFELTNLLLGTNVQRESKFIVKHRLSGGGAAVVMESDLDWRKGFLEGILNKNDYTKAAALLKECIERNLPDIDLHLICKPGTECLRKTAAYEFVEALTERVLKENSAYIDDQILYLTKTLPEQEKLEEHEKKLLEKLLKFQKLKTGKTLPEVVSMFHRELAVMIIQRNCFKKFSVNSFATIISIGELELVITENPDHLTIPDLLAYDFAADYAEKKIISLEIAHQTQEGKEAVLSRILKIAGLSRPANEHMLLKLCSFEAQGYWVPNPVDMQEACKAFFNYVYSLKTKQLTEDGITLLERYKLSHFIDNPEEGICALLRLYQQLEMNRHGRLLPLISSAIGEVPCDKKSSKLLTIVKNILTHYSHDFSLLPVLLKVYACIHHDLGEAVESEDPQSQENWLLFPSQAYVLRFNTELGEAMASLKAHALSGICNTFFNQAHDKIPPRKCAPLLPEKISKSVVYNAMDWVRNKHPRLARIGLYLLLRCPEPEAIKFLALHLPDCLKMEPQGAPRQRLFGLLKESFALDGMEECLNKFSQRFAFVENEPEDYLAAWMEILAEDHLWSEEAYKLWENLHSQNKIADSAGFAHRMLPTGLPWALKIISRTVCREENLSSPSIPGLQDRLYARLLQLFERGSSPFNIELISAIQPSAVWLIRNLYNEDKNKALKLCQSAPPSVGIWNCLLQSDFNFWPLCDVQKALEQLDELEKSKSRARMLDGVAYVFSLTSEASSRVKALCCLSRALPHIFSEKTNPIAFQNRLKLLIKVLDASKTDDDAVQKVRLPVLQNAVKECHYLQRTSTTINLEDRLRELTALLFSKTEHLKFPDWLDPKAFAELMTSLAKDTKLIQPCSSQILQIMPSLIKALKASKNHQAIVNLFLSLRAAQIPVEEDVDVIEAYCLDLIQELKLSKNPDGQIPRLFEKLGLLPAASPAWPLLPPLFQTTLSRCPITSNELFLEHFNRLPAVPAVLPYSEALLQEIQKHEKAGQSEQVFKLLKLAQEQGLTSPKKEKFENSARTQVKKYTSAGATPKMLENAAALMNCYPSISVEMLADFTRRASENPNRTLFTTVYELWGPVLDGAYPAIWTPEACRENYLNFMQALNGSTLFVSLLHSQSKILRHFNAPEHRDKKIAICRAWLDGCFCQIKDFSKLKNHSSARRETALEAVCTTAPASETSEPAMRDDYQALETLWKAYEEETKTSKYTPERSTYQLRWISLHGGSSSAADIFEAWGLINAELERSSNEEALVPLVPVIAKTLENTACLTIKLQDYQLTLLEIASNSCRNKLSSKLQASSWLSALSHSEDPRLIREGLEWLNLYFRARKDKKKHCPYTQIQSTTIKHCLLKAFQNPTERIFELSEPVLQDLNTFEKKDQFNEVWKLWILKKVALCLEIQDAVECCTKIYDALCFLEKNGPSGTYALVGVNFMKKLADLIPSSNYDLLFKLWNKCLDLLLAEEAAKIALQFEYQSMPVSSINFKVLKEVTDKNVQHYFNLCFVFYKALIESMKTKTYTPEQKALVLDLCYYFASFMSATIGQHPEHKQIAFDKLFDSFVSLAQPKDEELYLRHLSCIAAIMLIMLENNVAFETEEVFYKYFLLGGCFPRIQDYFKKRNQPLNIEMMESELTGLLNSKWDPDLSQKLNLLPIVIVAVCTEKNMFKSYSKYINFIELVWKYIANRFVIRFAQKDDEKYCFIHTPEFKLGLQNLLKSEPNPFKCGRDYLDKTIENALNLYNQEGLTFEDKIFLMHSIFNWMQQYTELAFDPSSNPYDSYYTLVFRLFNKMCSLFADRTYKDIKPAFDKFLPVLCTPPFPIFGEGPAKRGNATLQCIKSLASQKGTTFPILAKLLFKYASDKGVFEGLTPILPELNHGK